ncbi:MAG: hypothetical protein K9L30_05155 [Desulfobacterales bacterium]|nr:hypothetical protein [Desulfobacterales bacterium]
MGHNRLSSRRAGGMTSSGMAENLQFIIQKLDSIRAFKRADISTLENIFNELKIPDMWQELKSDVEKIVYLPHSIPSILRLIKIATTLKMLFPLCLMAIIFSIIIKMGFFRMPNDLIFSILLVFPVIIMGAFVITDLMIRQQIVRYETNHPDLHQQEKTRIKKVVEELLKRLKKAIREDGLILDECEICLYFNDYKGIQTKLTSTEKSLGLFKKKYDTYIVTPH